MLALSSGLSLTISRATNYVLLAYLLFSQTSRMSAMKQTSLGLLQHWSLRYCWKPRRGGNMFHALW